jgi:hypothetical protein
MTLILTAIHKRGLCIYADNRSTEYLNDLEIVKDNLKKIYKFPNNQLFAFNHGLNKFEGTSVNDMLSEYGGTRRYENKSIKEIALDFKNIFNDKIVQQLNTNIQNLQQDKFKITNFAFCGKDIISGKYEFHEITWSQHFSLRSWNDARLIGSGQGYEKYLKEYVNANSCNKPEYWKNKNHIKTTKILDRLFSIAVRNRNLNNGNEFSDTHDVDFLFD